MTHITRDPLHPGTLLGAVSGPDRGGTVLFLGTVRGGPEDGDVEFIEYSAYDEMAEGEFARIVTEAGERWPETVVAAQHRVGRVPLGEASIAVAAAAPHREQAFAACRWVVDEAKRRLPVWKKEHLRGGAARWRENDGTDRSGSRSAAGGSSPRG